ncbi:hypothetical protein M406DRAFT_286481 [Cryphonectria parasitica EP155]|uniref:5'-hydroxyaverantin dehydrogenase n=1 Tax=Cryphonectria parasitica (strain ATCC 38755 / EP155) TaxID=660469 RepID=A0A9P5CSX2_CRYP1|nr:uncharacterized protein M406DRAFT_286481 [Cryphonectria parasitica EP155]KAF3768560.1 hypothetical protein M406DRAFT_286481 [Cryphonectria parasitica EP155]
MAPLAPADLNRIVETIDQSAPVDISAPYSPSTLRGKVILITGGSSGLGAAFARHWASHGAHLIIGDINTDAGEALIAELRTSDNNSGSHHFIHCDVTSWASQASLFQQAVRLSPTGALDAVVASAGISDRNGATTGKGFENPAGLDLPNPPAPDLSCIQVNLVGIMYTAHLALFWLPRDASSPDAAAAAAAAAEQQGIPPTTTKTRDRHLLLVGSSAGLYPLPGVPEYVTSKHGVTGLFRSLRILSYRQGIRVNMLCPYFVDTPILPNRAVAVLSGLGLARVDDTVDAATRLVACDQQQGRIAGRALLVGPRMDLRKRGDDGDEVLVDKSVAEGKGQAVWEVYAHDYDTVDFFIRRYIRLLNTVATVKGWVGFIRDLCHTLFVRKDPKTARAKI